MSIVLLAGGQHGSNMGTGTGGGSRAWSLAWRPRRGRWQALECAASCCLLPLQCDSLETWLKHKAPSFVPGPCLIGLGGGGKLAPGGGHLPLCGHNGAL